ncbi:hypothetical protein R3P38DRAFT_2882826 [Favolaschia claudopus]|uniref:Uncharacterized protein n=1 Tax=Favolaschia claudopus TaxID=2862362 RepID=A0AAW0D3A8_9AGAR
MNIHSLNSSVATSTLVQREVETEMKAERLCEDLERIIFETAALSDPVSIPNLILVARRVKNWVQPFFCRSVFISHSSSIPGHPRFTSEFILKGISRQPPAFFSSNVRNLYIGYHFLGVNTVLGACSGVTELFLNFGLLVNIAVLNRMSRLQRLTIEIDRLFSGRPVDFSIPLFQNLTHLEILDGAGDRTVVQWRKIASLPNLTHLAFADPRFCPIFCEMLKEWKRLKCLILLTNATFQLESLFAVEANGDLRFVISGPIDFQLDWQKGVSGEGDYWEKAEEVIARKRAVKMHGELLLLHPCDKLEQCDAIANMCHTT